MEFSKSVIKLLKGLTVGLKLYSITEIKSHAYKICDVFNGADAGFYLHW